MSAGREVGEGAPERMRRTADTEKDPSVNRTHSNVYIQEVKVFTFFSG